MSSVFEINSKGLCLFCLQAQETSVEKTSNVTVKSFHCLMKYLKMDFLKLCRAPPAFSALQKGNGSLASLSIENISVVVTLCPDCEIKMSMFHEQYKTWSKAISEMDSCLQDIHSQMKAGNTSVDRMEEYRRMVDAPISSDIRISPLTDNWRNMTLDALAFRFPAVNGSSKSVPFQVSASEPLNDEPVLHVPDSFTTIPESRQLPPYQCENSKMELVDEVQTSSNLVEKTESKVDLETEPEANQTVVKLGHDKPTVAGGLSNYINPASQCSVTTSVESDESGATASSSQSRLRRSTRSKAVKSHTFQCTKCSGLYCSILLLNEHVKNAHKHTQCAYCGSIVATEKALERHLIQHHVMHYVRDQLALQQDVTSEQLDRFVFPKDKIVCRKNSHGDIGKYECPYCEKHFKILGFFKIHIFKYHLNHFDSC